MSTLIAYVTKHGCTEKCAIKVANKLPDTVELKNLKNKMDVNITKYEAVIIAGSIHAGQIQKEIKNFCKNNQDILKQKKIGLYICCMDEGKKAEKQFENAFPEELRKVAVAKGLFGGEFNFDKMNFVERFLVKRIAKVKESVSKIKEENIDKFVEKF